MQRSRVVRGMSMKIKWKEPSPALLFSPIKNSSCQKEWPLWWVIMSVASPAPCSLTKNLHAAKFHIATSALLCVTLGRVQLFEKMQKWNCLALFQWDAKVYDCMIHTQFEDRTYCRQRFKLAIWDVEWLEGVALDEMSLSSWTWLSVEHEQYHVFQIRQSTRMESCFSYYNFNFGIVFVVYLN